VSLVRLTQPAWEPVTVAEAFTHLRVDGYGESPAHPDLDLITSMVTVAREYVEDHCGLSVSPSDWRYALDDLPDTIVLPLRPVRSVAQVTYLDTDGVRQVLDPALYEVTSEGHVVRSWQADYPEHRHWPDSVQVDFTAGYTDSLSPADEDPLPLRIKQAALLVVGHLYENREQTITGTTVAEVPLGVWQLLRTFRRAIL